MTKKRPSFRATSRPSRPARPSRPLRTSSPEEASDSTVEAQRRATEPTGVSSGRWWLAAGALGAVAGIVALKNLGDGQPPVRTTLPAEPKSFLWRGLRLAWYAGGSPPNGDEAVPVLLLHGLDTSASAASMRALFQRLRTDHRVYAYDQLGFGASERPDTEYNPRLFMELLSAFLDEVVGRPTHVVAVGLSAAYALQVASERSEHFASLTLIDPVGLLRQARRQRSSGQALHTLLRTPVLGEAIYKVLVSRPFLKLTAGRLSTAFDAEELQEQYRLTHQHNARYAPAALLSEALSWNAFMAVRTVETPVLTVWATRPDLDDERQAFAGARPDFIERRLSRAGLPHVDHADEVSEMLREWFAGRLESISAS